MHFRASSFIWKTLMYRANLFERSRACGFYGSQPWRTRVLSLYRWTIEERTREVVIKGQLPMQLPKGGCDKREASQAASQAPSWAGRRSLGEWERRKRRALAWPTSGVKTRGWKWEQKLPDAFEDLGAESTPAFPSAWKSWRRPAHRVIYASKPQRQKTQSFPGL